VESRLARIDALVSQLDHQVKVFGPLAGEIIEARADVRAIREAQAEVRQAIRDSEHRISEQVDDIKDACETMNASRKAEAQAIRDEYSRDATRRSEFRGKVVVAVIAASATVLAAIIAAVAAIVFGG
jgi:hypothetical protein